ncbi:MAG: FtsX-like permease family protein [Saprospiraceae bacterium]|nr:FtsX-like permease family protein [Saprospiraceae bacterium]
MIKTYFKIAWRTLFQNKLYSTLNVVGLSFGLVCFFVLGLYVIDEMTYDGFHTHSDRIYRVIKNRKSPYEAINIAGGGFMLAEESKIRIGEIENTARMTQGGRDVLENVAEQKKVNEEITAANNGLMEIFDFEAIDGNPKTALVEPNSIVLVEELAVQLFGSTQVVGKTLKWQGLEQPFKVTAVIKNHPSNSSFHFSSVYSESTYFPDSSAINEARSDWGSHEYAVYALLRKDATPSVVSAKLSQLVNTNLKQVEGLTLNYSLQPIKDMHLYSEGIIDRPRSLSPKGEGLNLLLYAKMFALVAFFVLLTACINYMNLTTARASNRSKEIGIKKVVGAVRGQLIGQFLVESLVLTLFSFVLAVLAVNLILPAFNDFMQKQLSLGFSTDFRIWLTAISVAILAGLVAGSYPALMLSAFSPILLLKKLKITRTSDFNLRKGLVVFQFAISVSLIIATIVLFLQVQFVNNKDLGFNKDLLVVVDINSGKIRKAATTIVSEFEKIPNVKNVSSTSRVPGEWKTIPAVKIREMGKPDENKTSFLLSVDENFTKTFEIPLLAGRNFRSTGDSCSIILNETAAKLLNIKTPSEQLIEIPAASFGISFNPLRDNQVFKARVIGIVKDFNFQTLREKIAPLVLAYTQNPITHIDYYTARIETKDASATIKSMENVLAKIDAEEPFEYHYLDQQLALFYTEDARRQTMLIWVALATIFIACLGLFGLATYAVEQRIKEIGVRKYWEPAYSI